MRFFSILALSACLSAPTFAADLGTYRPGSPYNSVVAPGADVCENQCAGDAQCRGWNYVKVNPRAPGVCEFNSKAASPIESSISISGDGASMLSPRVSVGSTNTIRVGTSSAPRQRPVVTQSSPTRRIVREAVPQTIRPRQTVARVPAQSGSLTAQQNRFRQATGHVVPQRRQAIRQQAHRPQTAMTPRSAQQRLMRDPRIQQPRAQKLGTQQQRIPQRLRMQHNLDGAAYNRPPIGVPITGAPQYRPQAAATRPRPYAASVPKGSVNNPVTHKNAPQRIRQAEIEAAQKAAQMQAQRQAQLQAQRQAVSVEQAQQSLFGSLNDDVKIPRAMTELPQDIDMPIPTAQSRPSRPVDQEPLGALAGPPRR